MFLKEIRPTLVMVIALTLITGLAYPFLMTGMAQAIFPAKANGSIVEKDGKVIGSSLIGQSFSDPRYFHGRLSATMAADPNDPTKTVASPYNAANSAGSNLGPTNAVLIDRVKTDAARLAADNPGVEVPADLVTTSASGLDPDITPEAAVFQVPRVAKARGLPEEQVRRLIGEHVEERTFGLIGEPHVNVLGLNLALDGQPAR